MKIECGTLPSKLALAALEADEWKRKGEALCDAKRLIDECGATDSRRAAFVTNLASVRRRLDEAERAHRNALNLRAAASQEEQP